MEEVGLLIFPVVWETAGCAGDRRIYIYLSLLCGDNMQACVSLKENGLS